jgi:hypothetical protein
MLRRVLIASAAAAMLLVTTFHSDDAFARGGRGGGFHGGGMRAGGFHGALSVCAAGAWPVATAAIGVPTVQGPIAATVLAPIAATATASVQRRWAPLRSAPRRRGPITAAAAATTPTATGFARTGIGTERHEAVGLWCSKPVMRSSA